jgi:AhpD family alkylhydroperoxidase
MIREDLNMKLHSFSSFGGTALLVASSLVASLSALAQQAPAFMRDTYPTQALAAAVQEMGALNAKDAALNAKTRELIAVAGAANVPCQYCSYFHTKAAKANGASDAEIREALATAGAVRKWSTVLNGSLYSMDTYKAEVDKMFTPK